MGITFDTLDDLNVYVSQCKKELFDKLTDKGIQIQALENDNSYIEKLLTDKTEELKQCQENNNTLHRDLMFAKQEIERQHSALQSYWEKEDKTKLEIEVITVE